MGQKLIIIICYCVCIFRCLPRLANLSLLKYLRQGRLHAQAVLLSGWEPGQVSYIRLMLNEMGADFVKVIPKPSYKNSHETPPHSHTLVCGGAGLPAHSPASYELMRCSSKAIGTAIGARRHGGALQFRTDAGRGSAVGADGRGAATALLGAQPTCFCSLCWLLCLSVMRGLPGAAQAQAQPKSGLPRAMILSGMSSEEVLSVIDECKSVGTFPDNVSPALPCAPPLRTKIARLLAEGSSAAHRQACRRCPSTCPLWPPPAEGGVFRVVCLRASGLPETIFAAAVPRSWNTELPQLLGELQGDDEERKAAVAEAKRSAGSSR